MIDYSPTVLREQSRVPMDVKGEFANWAVLDFYRIPTSQSEVFLRLRRANQVDRAVFTTKV